jgi:UDP-N-acetylmuramoyl-tripeptide--D-alanyl-D-alanine ligase
LQLTEIAPPDVAVITNIGETHIELLGSIQNIAAAKGEILQGLKAPGTAVLNADDPLVVEQSKRAPGKILWFGQTSVTGAASLWADQVVSNGASLEYVVHWQGESRRVHLPWPGRHNLHNSLAALAVGLAFDLSLKQCLAGLSAYSPADNRLRFVPAKSGALIIDDTYNASPVSMRAALQVLHDYPQGSRRIAVLGDMLELGTRGQAAHHELGQLIGGMQLSGLFTVGPLAELIAASVKEMGGFLGQVRAFRDNTALASFLDSWLMPDDLVLIKGSRGMHMEDIVSHLAGEEGNGSDH